MASLDGAQQINDPNSNQPVKTTPKEALVMASVLKEMGVNEYEPRVINQMIEFSYSKVYYNKIIFLIKYFIRVSVVKKWCGPIFLFEQQLPCFDNCAFKFYLFFICT